MKNNEKIIITYLFLLICNFCNTTKTSTRINDKAYENINFYYNKQSTLKFIFSGTRHINMEITILKGNTKNKFVLFDSNFKDNKTIVF